MATDNGTPNSHTSTTIIAGLTLIVAVIAAIPAFLGLNKEQSHIFFSDQTTGIMVPSSLDEPKVRSILASNGIASDYVTLDLVNQGNKEAPEVRISVTVPGNIMSAWTVPALSDKPIWVQLPDLSQVKGQSQLQTIIKALAITKPVTLHIGYERTEKSSTHIDVFADGRPATRVEKIESVPPWSAIDVFRLPLIVLGIGLALVVLWAVGVVVSNNPKVETALKELLVKTATELLHIFPFGRF